MDLMECLREAVRDRDCCWKLTDTLIEDIEEMSDAHESKLATLRVKLDRRGLAPPSIEVECIHLRSWVVDLEDELAALTRRFSALDHTWDKERAALEVGKAEAGSRLMA